MKKAISFSYCAAIALFVMMGFSSCSKDDIDVNITWTEDSSQGSSSDKDNNGGSSDNNGSGGSGTDSGGSTAGKEKIDMFFKANVRGVFAVSSALKPIAADRDIMIDAYSAGHRVASQSYTSTASASLTSANGDTLSLASGTYDLYAVGINAANERVPAFNSSGVCSSLFNQTDYIWWSDLNYTPTYPSSTITLNFQHCATQVVVYVSPGSGITVDRVSEMTITPSNTSGCTWNLLTGVITPATSLSTTVAAMGVAQASGQFVGQVIMLPLKMSGNMTLKFNALLGGETVARSYSAELPIFENNLEAAHSYKYTVSLYEDKVIINSVNIIDWISVTANNTPIIPTQSSR